MSAAEGGGAGPSGAGEERGLPMGARLFDARAAATRRDRRVGAVLMWVVACGLAAFPTYVVGATSFEILRLAGSTEGVILESVHRSAPRGVEQFRIRYAYRVAGVGYESSRVHPGPQLHETFGHERVREYRPGQPVWVWYAPDDPADAVLERGWSADLSGIALMTWGILLLPPALSLASRRVLRWAVAVFGALLGSGFTLAAAGWLVFGQTIRVSQLPAVVAVLGAFLATTLGWTAWRIRRTGRKASARPA